MNGHGTGRATSPGQHFKQGTDLTARQRQQRCVAARRSLSLERLESRQLLSAHSIGSPGGEKTPHVDRIVGGTESPAGNWPWMVSLQSSGHFCGGSLVAADAVVTAAHCVEGSSIDEFEVVIGRQNLAESDGKVHQVSEIIVHPDYDPFINDSDIAILLLSSASAAKPVRLLQPDQAQWADPGRTALALGWGRLTEGGTLPDTLHEVSVPIVSNDVANADIAYGGAVTPRMLAAGFEAGGQDSCQGDSGGPLLVNDDSGQSYLAGIVSWGEGCARPHKYGIYTRVDSFAAWIDDTIKVTSAGSVNFTQERYGPEQTALIRLKDADLIGTAIVQVEVTTSVGDAESLILAEKTPGRFFGSVPLNRGAINSGNHKLDVQGGEQLRVSYADANDGTGQPETVDDIALVVTDDYGNDPESSTEIVPAVPVAAEIEISGDVDWFRFSASANMLYQIDVNLAGSLNDSVVELYNSTGEVLLAWNDDGGAGFASRLTWRPTTDGPVYVKVFGYGSNVGTYELIVTESVPMPDDHGQDAQNATSVSFDQPADGQLTSADDSDWFYFPATAGQSYEITAELLSLSDSLLRLIDTDGLTELAYNDDSPLGFGSRILWTAPTDGRRYIAVSGFNGGVGNYRLNVHEYVPPPDDHGYSPETATPISLPANVLGELTVDRDVDWFAFEASSGSTYQFDVSLTSLADSVLRLFDGQRNELAFNDDYQDELASRITWTAPQDGMYYVEVSSFDESGVGTYRLLGKLVSVAAADDHGNDAASASAIGVPDDVSASIAVSGDVDWFRFSAVAGLIYRMQTSAGTLNDTILRLIDGDGVSELARNDDYGTALTSLLQWRALNTGPLYVEVSGYLQSQGTYSIAVAVPYGDANLDGVFDSRDLVQVFQRGKYEDGIQDNSRWEDGDWNGDGEFNSADLVAAFQANEYSAEATFGATRAPAEEPEDEQQQRTFAERLEPFDGRKPDAQRSRSLSARWQRRMETSPRDAVFAGEADWNLRRGQEDWSWLREGRTTRT